MGNLWANFHIHGFEDTQVKIKRLPLKHSKKFMLNLGDNLLSICGTYAELKDIFIQGLNELDQFREEEEEDYEQERRRAEGE